MNEAIRAGQRAYWDRVRRGEAKSPHQVAKENKTIRKAPVRWFVKKEEPTITPISNQLFDTVVAERDELLNKIKKLTQQVDSLQGNFRKIVRTLVQAEPISDKPGVYFLCNEKEVVYVGMSSRSVHKRVRERAALLPVCRMISFSDKHTINSFEKTCIQLMHPNGNTQYTTEQGE